ncbi:MULTISPECIES: transcriptional regulator Spx [Bacillaceae]|uniref:Transcriptional regulator Spx n=1 Tax=Salicibibacter kimchii TaxID=2099786 RepID=A0A345C0U2_9BACI|nr:transcriptional regulator Spx [Salicibibacter kimchii]AXF56823.1 transcriptional regulator Spx [Salicibibacter kimchii]
MITVYTSSSCLSCRKTKDWLREHRLPFREIDITKTKLTIDEVKHIFSLTENGIDDVISRQSKAFAELALDMEGLSLHTLFQIICKYPSLLKRPIIMDDKQLLAGYHEEEIRRFLPRSVRNQLKEGIYV